MFYKEIKKLKKSELRDLLATTLNQKASLERANASLICEASTPKNVYLHETDTIFADSGELHLVSDNLNIVINCSNLIQDLAIINDLVIKEAKRDLSDSIQQIKQLTKDI